MGSGKSRISGRACVFGGAGMRATIVENHQMINGLNDHSVEQIHYAADDVRYLHEIYERLSEKLPISTRLNSFSKRAMKI